MNELEQVIQQKVKRRIPLVLIKVLSVVVLAGMIFFMIMSFRLQGKINVLESQPRLSVDANKSFIFMQDFIANVIGSSTEVDFETRLRLENEVRAINDPDILSKWKAFIASKNESEAQSHVLSILQRLIILVQSGAEVAI